MQTNLNPKDEEDPYADYTEKELYEFLSTYTLPRDIGAEFEYSNIGMELLGQILSLKAGTNYEALVVKRICAPLSLNSTRLTLSPELNSRLASGHDEKGKRVKNWSAPLPGDGGLRSSANDLLKYLSAQMDLTKTELQPAMALQQTPRHAADSPLQVGLGWMIIKLYGSDVVWHNGGSSGYHSFIGFNPKDKRGVVVLSGCAEDIDDLGMSVITASDEPPAQHVAIKLDPNLYDQFIGRYQLAPEVELILRREAEHLYVEMTDQAFLEIFPESETNFFLKEVEAQLSFVKNPQGTVTEVIMRQDGLDQTAKKTSNQSYNFKDYVPARHDSKAAAPDGKSLEDVLALMSGWIRAHPDFRLRTETQDDEGEKDEHIYLIHGGQWKDQASVKQPYQAAYVEFSTGTNEYLTWLPLTDTTVRNNRWDRDESNMNRLIDWRTQLSLASVTNYGFSAELLTNTPPFCLQIIKPGKPLLKFEYLVDSTGKILRTIYFNKSKVEIEWFKEWSFDTADIARQFDAITVNKQASKTDFDTAFAKEIMANLQKEK